MKTPFIPITVSLLLEKGVFTESCMFVLYYVIKINVKKKKCLECAH